MDDEKLMPPSEGAVIKGPRRLPKPNNAINVPTDSMLEFFKKWCYFHRPLINLSDREVEVVASILKQRWELSKITNDATILDAMMTIDKNKKKVAEECGITISYFYVIWGGLKRKHVVHGNILNPILIPNIRPDDNGVLQLMILFKNPELKQ